MASVAAETVDGRRVFKILWPQTSIPYVAYKALTDFFRKSRDYSKMTRSRLATIRSKLADINRTYGAKISLDQAMSIHHLVLKDKIIKGYGRMNSQIGRIAAEYNDGADICALSVKWDFPPMNLLRGIFLHNGKPASDMYNLFSEADKFGRFDTSMLSGRDLAQFKRAVKRDAYATFNQERVTRLAAENEAKFVDYFRGLGIALRTQEDLVEHQTAIHGRAVITPDILFEDMVYINGVLVKWIEFKSYCQTDVDFIYESNLRQLSKYAAKWGIGAMCYQLGLVESIGLVGAIPLDGQIIDAKVHFANDLFH